MIAFCKDVFMTPLFPLVFQRLGPAPADKADYLAVALLRVRQIPNLPVRHQCYQLQWLIERYGHDCS